MTNIFFLLQFVLSGKVIKNIFKNYKLWKRRKLHCRSAFTLGKNLPIWKLDLFTYINIGSAWTQRRPEIEGKICDKYINTKAQNCISILQYSVFYVQYRLFALNFLKVFFNAFPIIDLQIKFTHKKSNKSIIFCTCAKVFL